MGAKARQRWRELTQSGTSVGEPRLSIRSATEAPNSRTWRLIWTVSIGDASFFVDAVNGKSLDFRERLISDCFPRDSTW